MLITRDQIAARVIELGRRLTDELASVAGPEIGAAPERGATPETGATPEAGGVVLVPIMTGALVFTADLIRCLSIGLRIRPAAVSAYPGDAMRSNGAALAGDFSADLTGQHVVVIDDVLDSGRTLALVRRMVMAQRPASLRACVLLRKPESARREPAEADLVGFDIPDEFVVGYGLDFDGRFRNLPDIVVLDGAGP